jgi:hypothetical protein
VVSAEEPRILSDEEIQEWMQSVPWTFASTMQEHPHHYSLKRQQDPRRFEDVVLTIWECGYDRWYLRRKWRSLNVGEFFVWIHTEPTSSHAPAPLQATILVNRRYAYRTGFICSHRQLKGP